MKICLLMLLVAGVGHGAPVPSSAYLPRIYRYADAVLQTYDDQNFLRVLYTLSELSGKPKYRDAADNALRRFIASARPDYSRPWMLWHRCFDVAAEPTSSLMQHLLGVPATNHPGFVLRAWSAAYSRTTNAVFLKAIDSVALRLEGERSREPDLSLAIDCAGAAHDLPHPLAARLRSLAKREDDAFLKAASSSSNLLAKVAMMCVSRYENTGRVGYRDVIHRAAIIDSSPPSEPAALGQSISLQLAAWRSTARPEHLEQARKFADFAVEQLFKPDQNEIRSGMGTLALALTELHLHILYITAVRCPPNTIDR